MSFAMNKAQRIVLIVYCILWAYCCLWVPWRVPISTHNRYERAGYGWLWAGPYRSAPIVYDPPQESVKGWQVSREEDARPPARTAVLDVPLIGMRLLAATAIGGAAFLIAGMLKNRQHLN
jgi:hypothetical protein